MSKLVYRAWAKAIVFLIVAVAMFVLAHGYPLAKWGRVPRSGVRVVSPGLVGLVLS